MQHPLELSLNEWSIIQKVHKFSIDEWDNMTLPDKLPLLRFNTVPTFGFFPKPFYPEDIYMSYNKTLISLDSNDTQSIKEDVNTNNVEIGGEINYINGNVNIVLGDKGNAHRMLFDVDLSRSIKSEFHTHPLKPTYTAVAPPSAGDIAGSIELLVEYMSYVVISNKLDKRIDGLQLDDLPVQSELVFTVDGVYVYYLSYLLIRRILKILERMLIANANLDVYREKVDIFIKRVAIDYINYISKNRPEDMKVNRDITENNIGEYLELLESIGVIVRRFPYDHVDVYVKL